MFVRSGSIWSQQAYLKASNTGAGDGFGAAVSISGDTIVVGALLEGSSTTGVNGIPNESAQAAGAAYVFMRSSGSWSQQAYLKASNSGAGDRFGSSVSVSDDTIAIGAPYEDSGTRGINSVPDETIPESGAAYIFVRGVSGWNQQAYIKALNPGGSDQFGSAVCMSGESLIVGAYWEDGSSKTINGASDEGAANSGAAYVFSRNGPAWTQQAYLKASNSGANDWFGYSVSLSGDTAVVGAHQERSTSTGINSVPNDNHWSDPGAAYVFVRNGTIWSQQAYIKPSNNSDYGNFGKSVFISGNSMIVGAPGEDSSTSGINTIPNTSAQDSGAAYLFSRTGSTWTQQAYIKASNSGAGDLFGEEVCISGNVMIVSAPAEDSNTVGINGESNEKASGSGASYAFIRSESEIAQEAFLKSSNTPTGALGVNDNFGVSVAVSGDTVVIGSSNEDSSTTGVNTASDEAAADSGAAYVFVRSGGTWIQQAYLKALNTGAFDRFGCSVAVSGDKLVIGALNEDSGTMGVNTMPNENAFNSGAAYIFIRNGTTWTQQAFLKASNTGASDYFGCSVAVSGDTVVVGAGWEDSSTTGVNSTPNETATDAGAVYVFVRSGSTWTQQAYLKASNTTPWGSPSGGGDWFGEDVSISGNTIVIGAQREDSSTVGVNTTANEFADYSGAAYIFVRNGTTWSQQAYLKASNTHSHAQFGNSVAVSGDAVVVGARQEESSTTGVNSTPNRNVLLAGAAYVFVRSGTTWTQQAYLKASNTRTYDRFGNDVAISGNTIVVGSPFEDYNLTGVNPSLTGATLSSDSGAAYVFLRNGTAWTQQGYVKASNTGASDLFGLSVAVSDDLVIVGASQEDSSTKEVNLPHDESATDAGAVYVFGGFGPLNVISPSSAGITPTTATLGGNVVSDGGASITERGIVYSTTAINSNPLIGGSGVTKVTTTGTTGVFTVNVSGLNPGAGSSFMAYATNSSGTAYTTVSTFTTLNNNANLSGLVLSSGTLSPAFSSGTTAFTASVSNATTSLTVIPTVASATATVRVNNAAVTSGTASGPISLNVGSNVITTVVTAQDGTTKTYTVTVARIGPPTVTTPTSGGITAIAANLGGNVTSDNAAAITERGVVYSITATNSNPLIAGTGVSKVMGTGTTGVFTVGLSGLTNSAGYSFKAYATNSAGTSYTTVATFTTLSNNANLSNLVLSSGILSPVFASATTSYTASVPNTTTSLAVTPTSASALATIRVNGVAVASGTASGAISLNVGSNTISTVVTAQDGTTRTYTVTVTRAAAPPTLTTPTSAAIAATAATLGGNVTADGGTAITERGVIYSATATNSNPLIGGTGVTKVTGTGTTGVFAVNVSGLTNGTGYSFKAYAISTAGTSYTTVGTFTTLDSNANLSNLVLSSGILSPVFASATTSYTASVPNTTTSLPVTPTSASALATIRVNGVTLASGTASGALSLNVGSNTIDVRVTAQDGVTQRIYTIAVTRLAAALPQLLSETSHAPVGQGFTYQITSTSEFPVTFRATGLPAGLTLDPATGIISGTATEAGTYTVTTTVANAAEESSATLTLVISESALPFLSVTGTIHACPGQALDHLFEAANSPTASGVVGLPPGLVQSDYNDDGVMDVINGIPQVAGSFRVTFWAENALGRCTRSVIIPVNKPAITTSAQMFEGLDVRAVAMDSLGNTFLAARIYGSVVLGSTTYTAVNGNVDGLIIKMSPTGQVLWCYQLTGDRGCGLENLAVDSSGNVVACGGIDPYSSTFGGVAVSGQTFFVVKLTTEGVRSWTRVQGTGGDNVYCGALAVDGSNNIWAGGYFQGSLGFSNSSNTILTSASLEAINNGFVAGFSSTGTVLTPRLFSSTRVSQIYSLVAAPNGTVFVAGNFSGNLTVPGSGSASTASITLTNPDGNASQPSFVAAIGGTANAAYWAKQIPDGGFWLRKFMVADSSGGLYVTGNGALTGRPASSLPANSIALPESSGGAFLMRLSASSSYELSWIKGLPDNGIPALAYDGANSLYLEHGSNFGKFDNILYNGNTGRYLAKINTAGSVLWVRDSVVLQGAAEPCIAADLDGNLVITAAGDGSAALSIGDQSVTGSGTGLFRLGNATSSGSAPVITSTLSQSWVASRNYRREYTYQIQASNSPTSYWVSDLPEGVQFDESTGLITATPSEAGTYTSTIWAMNAAGYGSATLTITVTPDPDPEITSPATATVTVGQPFIYQITATNSPTSFSAIGINGFRGELPDGLSFNATIGLIQGTPILAGSTIFFVRAANATGDGGLLVRLTIAGNPAIAPPTVQPDSITATVGQPLSYQIQATGAVRYRATWSGSSASGLICDRSTGLLTWTPAATGTYTITLEGTNGGGVTSALLQVTVNPANLGGSIVSWRQQYFGSDQNSGNAADLAAPDGDGIPNLVKYALRIQPGQNGTAGLPKAEMTGPSQTARLSLRFHRDPTRTDVSIIIEAQDGLGDGWSVIARSVAGAPFAGLAEVTEVADTAQRGGNLVVVEDVTRNLSRFMRVRVERGK